MRKGTPKKPNMPALMVNDTGTVTGPETCSSKSQRASTTPGIMNKNKVLKKITRGNAATADRKGPMRIKATALSSTI